MTSLPRTCVSLALAFLALVATASAQDPPVMKLSRAVTLNEVGDAQIKLEIKMPTELYTTVKTVNPNTAVLLRRLGNGTHWAKFDKVDGRFDDNTNTVVINYVHLGMARMTEENTWEIPVEADAQIDLVGVFGNTAVFTAAEQTPFGVATLAVRVEAPKEASALQLRHAPERVSYKLAPASSAGSAPAAEMAFEAKPQIMSCLAKSYGDARLSALWVGRSVMKNTGDQPLCDYRVRFRLSGFSAWSEWKRTKRVLPGQTVVDAYFPVLDIEKLAQLSGARPVTLELEYQYREQGGRLVEESDARQVQLLGRNQIIFSSLKNEEACGFHDRFNYAPIVLASFVSCDDPLMQELGGRVSQMAGGPASSLRNEDAAKFLAALYNFLTINKISYQTPPGGTFQGQFGQHLKYGRDVLRNRAGTCIDLAVLYASVCESVGLTPVLYVIPGHCFPAVRMPGGQLVPVEATMIGRGTFLQAVETAEKTLREARASGNVIEINVKALHDMGVHSLDLPAMEAGYLDKHFQFPANAPAANAQNPSAQNNVAPPQNSRINPGLVGSWMYEQSTYGVTMRYGLVVAADGSYAYAVVRVTASGATPTCQETGAVTQDGNQLRFTPNNGQPVSVYRFKLNGDTLELQQQGAPGSVTFRKVQ